MNLADWACGHCGRVYNPVLRDRFFADLEVDGEAYELLCEPCRIEIDDAFDDRAAVASSW